MGSCCSTDDTGIVHHQPNYPTQNQQPATNPYYPPDPVPVAPAAQMYPPPNPYPQPEPIPPPQNMYPPPNPYPQPEPIPPPQNMYPPPNPYPQPEPIPHLYPSIPTMELNQPPASYDDTGYKWMHMVAGMPVPESAVVGGMDIDGATIYVGRALHEGDMLPAKVIPEKNVAYICHGGREVAKHTFEVLTKSDFNWEYASNGHVPANAVIAGQTSDGEPLYVGRAMHEGSQTIGKVQQSHGCLYIPFDGQEISHRDYEVLVMH